MKNRIVFKCAFGRSDGWGHVVRCSALASEFQRRGWETALWSDGDLMTLPEDVASAFDLSTCSGDLSSEILLIDEMYTDQAVLEACCEGWRQRNPGCIVAGVDDMQRRSMKGFDLVVNSEIGLGSSQYASKHTLLGERFALLRSGFREPSTLRGLDDFQGRMPVLVMIGGTDAFGFLPRALDRLSRLGERVVAPVVIGAGDCDLSSALESFSVHRVLRKIDSGQLAAWMRFCRVGVLACGSSLYEAAAAELPFVGLSIVDNQTAFARRVEQHWGMPVLHLEEKQGDFSCLETRLLELSDRPRIKYSEVDTLGVSRVFEALEILCV